MTQVENIKSELPTVENLGNNQQVVKTKTWEVFYSYGKAIAAYNLQSFETYLDANLWDYSKTTIRYRNEFLNMETKEVIEAISKEQIKFTDLN